MSVTYKGIEVVLTDLLAKIVDKWAAKAAAINAEKGGSIALKTAFIPAAGYLGWHWPVKSYPVLCALPQEYEVVIRGGLSQLYEQGMVRCQLRVIDHNDDIDDLQLLMMRYVRGLHEIVVENRLLSGGPTVAAYPLREQFGEPWEISKKSAGREVSEYAQIGILDLEIDTEDQ